LPLKQNFQESVEEERDGRKKKYSSPQRSRADSSEQRLVLNQNINIFFYIYWQSLTVDFYLISSDLSLKWWFPPYFSPSAMYYLMLITYMRTLH